jgi:hypothetical protein
MMVRFLEQNQHGLYRKMVWGLRWRRTSRFLGLQLTEKVGCGGWI